MRISTLIIIFISLLFNGCMVFENMTKKERIFTTRKMAKNSVYLSIMSIYDEEDEIEKRNEIARIIKEDISKNIINILSNKSISISKKTLNEMIKNIPEKVRPFLISALDLAEIAKVNIDNVKKYKIEIIKAIFDGIIDGCDMVLEDSENNVMEKNSN